MSKKRVEYANRLWDKQIVQFDKQYILENTARNRDKKSSDLANLDILDIGAIIRQTMLLKRIIKIKDGVSKPLTGSSQYDVISDWNDRIFGVEEDHTMIESGLATMLYSGKLDARQTPGLWLFTDLYVCPNEQYGNLAKHYDTNYNLMSSHQAHEKARKWKDEIEQIRNNLPKPHPFTAQEFVSTNYDHICTIYLALSRNKMFYQAFDLESYKEIMNEPSDVMRLVNSFERKPNQISYCTKTEFLVQAKQVFKEPKIKRLEAVLILSETNQNAFPLFVGFQKNGTDCVLIPHEFAKLVYTQLHAVLAKSLFDKKTAKRGRRLEKKIQKRFEEAGFRYFPNVKDKQKNPTLEIDGIAVKGNHCFIVESKVKGITKLMEEQHTVSGIITDLKGIVDGFETSQNRSKLNRMPSLLKKIEFARKYVSSTYIKTTNNLKLIGMIVTTTYPWISEYKGVRIITYDVLSAKLSEDKILELDPAAHPLEYSNGN